MDVIDFVSSDVGQIPSDWHIEPIGRLCSISAGGDLEKRDYSEFQNPTFPYPIFANALTNRGLYGFSRTAKFSAGDVTITARGDVGHSEYRNAPFNAIGRLLVLKTEGKLDARCLSYFINARVAFALESTGVPQLTAPQVAKYIIAYPPTRSEQQAIAAALSDAEFYVDSLEQLIVKKGAIKQGVAQSLLGGVKRLPGYITEDLKETPFGQLPSDWPVRLLKDIVDETRSIRYGIVQPGDFSASGRYMIRGQDYSRGWCSSAFVFRVSDKIEEPFRNARVREGDLVITIVGASCGTVEQIPQWLDGANLTQTTARLAIDGRKADAQFVKYMLRSMVGTQQVASYLKGGAQPGLNCGDLENFLLPLPESISEQSSISKILTDIDSEISDLAMKLEKARHIKQGMIETLLTGRVRLQ
jgi:type I restriction enzyme S subunit